MNVPVVIVTPADSDSAHNAAATARGNLSQSRFSFLILVFPVSPFQLDTGVRRRADTARQHRCAFLAVPADAGMLGVSPTGLLI
jgi:hypothetical protein